MTAKLIDQTSLHPGFQVMYFDDGTAFAMIPVQEAVGTDPPPVSPSGAGIIYFDKVQQKFLVSQSAAPYVPLLGGAGAGTVTNTGALTSGKLVKGNGGVDLVVSKVSITEPATAGVLAFGVDNATLTFQGTGTVVNRDSTDTLTNKSISAAQINSGLLATARGALNLDVSGIAKGGMVSGSGAGTFTITTVGTDTQVWTADSASAGGAKWANVPGGVSSVTNSDGSITISPNTGAVVASLNLGHGNTWTAAQNVTVNQNGLSQFIISNTTLGTSALAVFSVINDVFNFVPANGLFGLASSGYTGILVLQNRVFIDANALTAGIALNTEAALPILFSVNNAEAGRFTTTGNFTLVGTITATKYNGLSITTSTGTLTVVNGKSLTVNKTLTLESTVDGATITFQGTGTIVSQASIDTLLNKTLAGGTAVSSSITFASGVRQTFAPSIVTPGLNVGGLIGDPSIPINGDLWYDTANGLLRARIAGASVSLGAGGGGGTVSSVFGRSGSVIATSGDYTVAQVTGAAPLASPAFTGTPAAPTAAFNTNTTQLATTAFVIGQGYAPLASPAFSGTPTAPTAAGGSNTSQVATTAFVQAALSGAGAVTSVFGRAGAVVALTGDYTAAKVTNAADVTATNSFTLKQNIGALSFNAASSLSIKQIANGNETLFIERNTDTGFSGRLITCTSVAATIIFSVDVNGAVVGNNLSLGGGAALTSTAQTGTGSLVLANSPTLVTPNLGTASATAIKSNLHQDASANTMLSVSGTTLQVGTGFTLISFQQPISTARFAGTTAVNGQYAQLDTLTELVAVGNGVSSQTTVISIPADSIVLSVSMRALTPPGGTAKVKVTGTLTGTVFTSNLGAGMNTGAGNTDLGTRNCPFREGLTPETLTLVFDAATTNSAGQIRVTILFISIQAPTS